jgi:hypothetical protein
MSIPFVCSQCKTSGSASDAHAGRQVYCPKCKAVVAIPSVMLLSPANPPDDSSKSWRLKQGEHVIYVGGILSLFANGLMFLMFLPGVLSNNSAFGSIGLMVLCLNGTAIVLTVVCCFLGLVLLDMAKRSQVNK